MNVLKFLMTSRQSLGRAVTLITSQQVPLRLKLIAAAAALFIISPLNILGDIPLLGIVDDVALLGFLINWFVGAAAKYESGSTNAAPPAATPATIEQPRAYT